jgi:preprotein translocase subunit SecE
MAKTRAQRKAERRRRQAQQQRQGGDATQQSEAQHRTQVPESADVLEAELAEHGADLDALKEAPSGEPAEGDGAAAPTAPAPSRADVGVPTEVQAPAQAEADVEAPGEDKISRRARRRAERERRQAAKDSARRRERREEPAERQRGAVAGFFSSVMAELRRVQWPDRETLIQATGITIVFIAVMAAYLGVLDAIFNEVVQAIL